MKVFEILRRDVKCVTEEEIKERMSRFNWHYEFSEDVTKLAAGMRELELIENMIYQLWKTNPEKAIQLWNTLSPDSPADKTVVPSFIFRLQNQEP